MNHFTTLALGLVEGHEREAIDEAIAQGCTDLSEEISGPVELVSVSSVLLPGDPYKLCVTVIARPYQPPTLYAGVHAIQEIIGDAMKRGRL